MTSAPAEFSLRATVREVLDRSNLTDPRALAAAVLNHIDDEQLRAALVECLPEYVRIAVGNTRSAIGAAASGTAPASGRSWKVEALQDYGQRLLRQRIHVASAWKFLGDCAPDDLFAAAAERRNLATQTLLIADRYERVGKAVEHAGVDAVKDLPPDVLQRAWETDEVADTEDGGTAE